MIKSSFVIWIILIFLFSAKNMQINAAASSASSPIIRPALTPALKTAIRPAENYVGTSAKDPVVNHADNPVADPSAVVISGNMRFTILTPEMIRIEHSLDGIFEDRASFVVLNRRMPVPEFKRTIDRGWLIIQTDALQLKYKIGSNPEVLDSIHPNLQISFKLKGEIVEWYYGKKDQRNLKGTTRTLDGANGDVRSWMEDGLLSRSGWAVIDEKKPRNDGSYSLMLDGTGDPDWVAQPRKNCVMDLYFMGYGHNYKKALFDFTQIAGKIPLPPKYVFGYWYSKYQRYTELEMRDIVNEVKSNNIPLDVLVIDMDWHKDGYFDRTDRTMWTGWSWNKTLFPDPPKFISWLHDQHLKTTLNLHPAEGVGIHEDHFPEMAKDLKMRTDSTIPWNIENKTFYKTFFKDVLQPLKDIGIDFWWLDWQQWKIARNEPNLGNTFWLNHVFFNDMKLKGKQRPVIFHRWGGLGNHRYQIGFSGDTYANFPSLAFQPYFTATASNVGYGYWSHDIGGHQAQLSNDPERYLRWLQFGVFSPILRTHATNSSAIERRIWKYDNFPSMLKTIELRYAIIPYIYTYSRYAYDTGISLCRPMYYDYPEVDDAYQFEGQYMFGNDMLVAPVCESDSGKGTIDKTLWLPKGKWYETANGVMLDGDRVVTRKYTQDQIPYFLKEGSIIPLYSHMKDLERRPDTIIFQFVPGTQGEFSLYEDADDNDDYTRGQFTLTTLTQSTQGNQSTYTIQERTGFFEGMPASRDFRFDILDKDAPVKVMMKGKKLPYVYNQATRILSVNLNKIDYKDLPLSIIVNSK